MSSYERSSFVIEKNSGWSTQLDEDAFFNGLNENGFFNWVEWERLFRLCWMGTAFSTGLNGDGFFQMS
jgi:hypothetical protein